ncbi:MAG: thiamine pyrophosphate-binding protein [Trebonia sp.]
MKVYEALAGAFVDEGTTDVFGMMGDANMHWMNDLARRGVNLYEVRHEGSGLGLADGWARTAGRPGVVTTTSGPGTAQLATSMLAASRARTALVAFCGETDRGDEGAVQYLDQRRFAAAIECGFVHVGRPDLAQDAVQRAFFLARTESRPVMLSAPADVQLAQYQGDQRYVPSSDLIGGARLLPDPAQIRSAADIIEASGKVVIIVGRGARRAGTAPEVLRLQEQTGALLATTLQAKNWLRGKTEYHAGISGGYGSEAGLDLLREADCVIAVGASLNSYTIDSGQLYQQARYVQIDTAAQVVLGNGGRADCFIRADAAAALAELTRVLDERAVKIEGFHTALVRERLSAAEREQRDYVREPGRVDPREAIRVIDAELPEEIPLVLGSGHQVDFGTMLFSRPREVLSNYGMFGAIGQAPLLTIGAIVARGGQPAFVVEGDASFIMHLPEFETACRYRLPLLAIIMNDEGLGAEYHKSLSQGLDPDLATIPTPDLGRVAVALGGRGTIARTAPELAAALRDYLSAPAPTVIDVRISRKALSARYRRVGHGASA